MQKTLLIIIAFLGIVLGLQVRMYQDIRSLQKQKAVILPMYPKDSNSMIVKLDDDKDYMFAWWLWGPYSQEEVEAKKELSPGFLKKISEH